MKTRADLVISRGEKSVGVGPTNLVALKPIHKTSYKKMVALGMLASCFAFSSLASAADLCESVSLASPDVLASDAGLQALVEEHSLSSLVSADPKANLVVQHPMLAMSAFQRAYAWSTYMGMKRVVDPRWRTGKVNVYPVFSTRTPMTGGKKIVGQFEQIQAMVDYFRAGSRGDGSVSKMPLLTGPAGTGKTEFLSILARLAGKLAMTDDKYYLYTFDWKNLHEFPELRDRIGAKRDREGKYSSDDRRSALRRSPLVLLPTGLQRKVIGLARDNVIDMIGYEPRPLLAMDPQDQEIRDTVVAAALKNKKISDLSEANIVKALEPYVSIRRRVFVGGKEFPIVAAQGRDVNYNQLFAAENAPVIVTKGSDDPFAYHLNGKIPSSDGGVLLLDEFFRNPEELRDVFLGVVENHRVDRGGMPPLSLDVVIIGASNDESVTKAKEAGTAKAHLDRSASIPMRLSTHPVEIAETMLVMKGSDPDYPATLLMKKLEAPQALLPGEAHPEAAAPVAEVMSAADLDKVFPLPQSGEGLAAPDGKYVFYVSMGANSAPVLIAPHTLMYIAYTVAATRMKTDADEARELGAFGIIKEGFFTDAVTRIRVLMDKLQLSGPEKQELKKLTDLMKEGDSGLSNRDAANIWLTRAIEEASRPENENTLTPRLAQKVFRDLLNQGTITYRGHEERTRWMDLDSTVISNLIVPQFNEDWSLAMSHGSGAVESIYTEVMNEILAISANASAMTYEEDGMQKPINFVRYQEISRIYQNVNKMNLAPAEVMNFKARYGSNQQRRHDGLWRAVTSYVASNAMKNISIKAIEQYMRTGTGEPEVERKYGDLRDVFINQLGYNERALKEAIGLLYEASLSRNQL